MTTSPLLFLFFSDYIVNVYSWKNSQLTKEKRFDNTAEGRDAFAVHWQETGHTGPVHLLIDLIEEDVHNEVIPRLLGSNRKKMLEGRAARLFRNTPFHFSHLYGNVAGEERQEQVLFIGLTDPDKLLAWLALLQRCQAQVAGMVSVPLLCQELFKKMAPTGRDALLIVPNAGGLRQIFLRDGRVMVSRFSILSAQEESALQGSLHKEVERMQGYLDNLHLVALHTPLEVFTLCHGSLHALLTMGRNAISQYKSNPVHADALARQLEIPVDLHQTRDMEPLLCGMLLKQRHLNHYARPEDTRLYRTARLRTRLRTVNVSLFLVSLLAGGGLLLDGLAIQAQWSILSRQVEQAQSTGPGPARPSDRTAASSGNATAMAAVRALEAVREHATEPQPMLLAVSQALTRHPDIQVNRLEWFAGPPDTPTAETRKSVVKKTARPARDGSSALSGNGPGLQNARLQGQVHPFAGDMVAARQAVQTFADTLRTLPAVQEVAMLTLPVDPTQTAVLDRKNMVTAAKQADFTVLITLQADRKGHE
ncbi:MAG: hypothetical protein H7838_01500 [Magnetococcus sp. DMHC-8]